MMDPAHGRAEEGSGDPRRQMVERALKRVRYQPDALIEVLHVAQEAYGCLSRDLLERVGRALHLPESEVYGVATFYHFFTLRPPGEHTCVVCTGTVCHLQGAPALLSALEGDLGVKAGETRGDGRLSLGTARCLGNCTLAPMLALDGRVLGRETPATVVRRVREALGEEGAEGA